MLTKLFRRRARPDPRLLRKAKPLRNPQIHYELLADGTALLEAPMQAQKGLAGVLARKMKAPDTKKFEFEAVGAFVWELCDGKNTVEGIAKKLREKFKMNHLEAEASLSAFLQTLVRKQLVTVTMSTR